MSMIIAMCIFSFSMSISPGPVNFISLSSSARYGLKKTLPFVSGATIGFTLLLTGLGLGLSKFLNQDLMFFTTLKYCGIIFIGYTGYKIVLSNPKIELQDNKIPNFIHGFLINIVNPKAWIACISGISAFDLGNSSKHLLIFITLYFLICYPSLTIWAILGSKINLLLKMKNDIYIFNKIMGIMLIFTSIYLVFI